MARYFVYDGEQHIYVGSIRHSRRTAERLVRDFGPMAELHTLAEARGHFRDDENEWFWIYHSQYGAKYRCKLCRSTKLGKGNTHPHKTKCPLYEPRSVPPVAKPMPLSRPSEERIAPSQESLTDQMHRVLSWANRSGLYDAADWISARWSEAGGR